MLKVKGDWILAESHHALWGRLTFASPYIDPPTHQRIWIDFSSSDPIESVTLPQTARECATHTHNKQAESNFTAWHDLSSMLLLPTQNEWACLPTSPIIIYLFFPRRGKCLRMRSRCSRGRARRACGASMCVSGPDIDGVSASLCSCVSLLLFLAWCNMYPTVELWQK